MTPEALFAVDLGILVLMAWVLDLVRRGRLYVGYGVLSLFVLAGAFSIVTAPVLFTAPSERLRAIFGTAPLPWLAAALVTLVLIYVLHQLTVLSNRVTSITQELAIRGSGADHRSTGDRERSTSPSADGSRPAGAQSREAERKPR